MARQKNGPILNAKLIESIEVNGELVDLPTYEDLMATYNRTPRGYRIVKGYEALLIAISSQSVGQ